MSTVLSLADLRAHLVPARDIEARENRGRLSTGSETLDEVLGGGWPRGAVSEVRAARSQGRTSVLLATIAATLQAGHAVALIDFGDAFDPGAAARAGVLLDRLLWVRAPARSTLAKRTPERLLLSAAETIVSAGGFGLLALDFGERVPTVPSATWLRLRQLVAGPGTVVLVSSSYPLGSLFGATSLGLDRARPQFFSAAPSPAGLQESARPRGPALLTSIETEVNLKRAAGESGGDSQRTSRLPLLHCPA